MSGSTAIFTIIAKNYLAYARVLMRSAAKFHPDWRRFVILVDRVDGYFDPAAEDFEIVLSSDLPIPRSRWFHFKYSVMELSTAVKPYAFEYLFGAHGFDRIVYLDPDIELYWPLDKVVSALDTANIALTPHLTGALDDDRRPSEIDILRAGAYNLGFIGISRTPESSAFLAWWQQRLYDHCVVDLPRGLFVDQRWVDLVPGLFEGVAILRDPGLNVAYWNVAHRTVVLAANGYEVDGSRLCFFHFSGYDPLDPDRLSCHQNRFRVDQLSPATQQLLVSYRDSLLSAGYASAKAWPYAFGFFQNGERIPDLGRPMHLEQPQLVATIDDPFSEEGFRAFVDCWNHPVEIGDGTPSGISRLAYRIYRTRADVQSAMPDIFGGHYRRFLEWMLVSGRVEHELGDVFLTTIADAIATCKDHQKARAWPETSAPNEFGEGPADAAMAAVDSGRLRLTRIAAAIYEARPELQRYFPDPAGRDAPRFLVWLLTYGKKEHHLSSANLAPLEKQWRSIIAALPGRPERARYELVRMGMAASVHVRGALARVSIWRSGFVRRRPPAAAEPLEIGPPREFGVNLVGYFHSETGVGQSVRAARAALQAATVPLSLRCVGDNGPSRQQDFSSGPMSTEFPYSVNLVYVNADQTHVVRRNLGESFYRHRHNIGFWVWELDEFPGRWRGAFSPYREIWTPSTFCRDAVARKAPIPVFRVPYSVAPQPPPGMDRQHFGLAPDRFIFLTAFDVLSVPERKNPMGAIRAFEKAFGSNSGCELVIKVNHAAANPGSIQKLRDACSNGSVRLLDSTLNREEMDALLNCADCFVSLHRSEGFGLLIAEAMHMGKPVVVTNYSGNTDFTRPDNSLLVDYRLVPVGPHCAPYDPASRWAEPDIEQAAAHLRTIAKDSELRARLSHAGRTFVRETLSAEAVGHAMSERLEQWRETQGQVLQGVGDGPVS